MIRPCASLACQAEGGLALGLAAAYSILEDYVRLEAARRDECETPIAEGRGP